MTKEVGDILSQRHYFSRDSKVSYACKLPMGLVMKRGMQISMYNYDRCFGHAMVLEMLGHLSVGRLYTKRDSCNIRDEHYCNLTHITHMIERTCNQ